MKYSVLGPGNIAKILSATIQKLDGVELYAAASRDEARAKVFAKEWGYQKAYGSYEEMLQDPQVELVHVATPHSHHYEHAKMCLEHGKHVLLEKAFTVNARQAEELIALARKKNLLLAEAIWPRYMPKRQIIDGIIARGEIGEPKSLYVSLGHRLDHVERMKEPSLAGGALLDLGVYTINFALMAFPGEIARVESSAMLTRAGVDAMSSTTITFDDGKTALLHSNMMAYSDQKGMIYGTKGYIEVPQLNNCPEILVHGEDGRVTAYPVPEQISGYEYEILACKKAIEAGQCECEEMPHEETLRVMRLMDQMRALWSMKYPGE